MALAGLRKGTDHLKASSGGKFSPYISWSDGDTKTVAFLTPLEEVAKVRIHNFVKIADENSQKGFRWGTFVCRKDPAFTEESGGTCPLCDIVGHKATEKHCAIAIELEATTGNGPVVTSLGVKTREGKNKDGKTVEYPQWGLVMQSFGNFFNWFSSFGKKYGGINDIAFDITRVGDDKNTTYPIIPLMNIELPDFSQYNIPTLEDVIEQLGSKEKYDNELDNVKAVDQAGFDDTYNSEPNNETMKTEFEKLKESLPTEKLHSYSGTTA